jgi:Photoprotection regulator fluorescence recovery protein
MQSSEMVWSTTEQAVVEAAFKVAYEREIVALIKEVQYQADSITGPEDMWQLHDFLSARRHSVDGKYDRAEPTLMFAFARLVKEKWIAIAELEGLDKSKLSKISALSRM